MLKVVVSLLQSKIVKQFVTVGEGFQHLCVYIYTHSLLTHNWMMVCSFNAVISLSLAAIYLLSVENRCVGEPFGQAVVNIDWPSTFEEAFLFTPHVIWNCASLYRIPLEPEFVGFDCLGLRMWSTISTKTYRRLSKFFIDDRCRPIGREYTHRIPGYVSIPIEDRLFPWDHGHLPHKCLTRWWFHIFIIFTPTRGRFPFWLIFFKGVETTN